MPALACNICGASVQSLADCERGAVCSNVRQFRKEQFELWRCPACSSLHSIGDVDLDHYYRGYPIFVAALDWKLDVVYGAMLRRLTRAGLRPEHRILDYGCGSGTFVEYLKMKGYTHAVGYDAFAEKFRDASVLDARYDCVVSQDVIEHVDEPIELIRRFDAMVEPGGLIAIGTPDASAIDLSRADDFIHTLHQPYHRHILSAAALHTLGEQIGWSVERFYSTMYNNTLVPTMNPRFVLHYVRCNDDCFDLITEPIHTPLRLFSPVTLFYAIFGFFFDRHTDIQFMFRKAAEPARLTPGRAPGGE
jgi:2-polyprenyl-3-methyl-5-hydroxy-6-metoxy-1,4-benzoquinol methylase